MNVANVQNMLCQTVVVQDHLPHCNSPPPVIHTDFHTEDQFWRISDQVWSLTKDFFFLSANYFVSCYLQSTLCTRQGKKKKKWNWEFFSKRQESVLSQISLAVKNNVLCHARLSSRASFPGFPSYHSQGLLLSPPVWSGQRCNWEPCLHILLA